MRGGYPEISFLGRPGLEQQAYAAQGRFPAPPMHHLVGLRPVAASEGSMTFEMPVTGWLQGPVGDLVVGAASALVADAPLGGAILTVQPAGRYVTTSHLAITYVRPARLSAETLTCEARVIQAGRSAGISQGAVRDRAGNLIAHATTRVFIRSFPPPEAPAEPPEVYAPAPQATPDPYLRTPPARFAAADWDRLGGLEALRAHIREDLPAPPICHLTGIRPVSAEEGSTEWVLPASPWLTQPARAVYGGFIALLADQALTGAIGTLVPPGSSHASLDLGLHFLRPVAGDGRDLRARGRVVHRGRTLAVAEAEVWDADGRMVANASGSCMVLEGRPWDAAASGGDD